jgi:hypothetical protein
LTILTNPAFSQIPLPPSGTIIITCRLGDAPYSRGQIFVDGRKIGECPEATIKVSTGVHSVRAGEALGKDRYLAYQNERVEVGENSRQLIVARVAPSTTENAAGLAYALGAKQVDINHLDRPDDSKTGALSPDGKILAIGAETNSIRLYDASNFNPLRRLGQAGAYWVSFVNKLSFSPDGSLLASSGWLYEKYIGEINIWNITTGRLDRTIPNVKEVFSIGFSPDGNLLAAGVGVNDRQIGVGHPEVGDERQRDMLNAEFRKISTREFGGRAIVTIGGMLRNSSRRDFAWYQYRFDILSVEDISPVILPYERELQAGVTYSAAVRGDRDFGLALLPPPRINLHHAQRIEWTNLSEFPELEKLRPGSQEHQIVFTVLSDEINQMTVSRWNRTLTCKIIRVEKPPI